MKTNVATTSIDAYHAIQKDGTLSKRQAEVLAHIKPGKDYSLQELARLTGLGVNIVSARCHELRAAKVLELGPTRKCVHTGRSVHPVRRPALPPILEAAKA